MDPLNDYPSSSLFQVTACNGSNCSCRNHAIPKFQEADIPSLRDDPRYHHLTHTNNVPAPAEEAAIRDMISDLHSRLNVSRSSHEKLTKLRSDIMAQAAHITDCLQSLHEEQKHMSLAIEERKCLLSPVRRLPSEILSQIFSLTVVFPVPTKIRNDFDAKDNGEWRELLSSENMLWTIELVCKDWRRVVLQRPELWANLNVNLLGIDEKAILRLAVQLSRIGLANLSVGFYCHPSIVVDASAPLSRIVFLLLPFASRITYLVLCMPLEMMLELSPVRNHLRALKTLDITCFSYSSGRVQVDIFEACPQLNSVTFVDMDDLHFFPLPWKAIQTFRTEHAYLAGYPFFNGPQPSEVLQVLQLAPHIRECHVRVESCRSPPDTELEGLPIICSHLSTLSVKVWPLAGTCPVQETLDGMVAPALSKLMIETAGDEQRDTAATFAAVQQFIERSQAPLTTLHFSHGELAPDDVLRFLSLTPLLSELRLIDCGGLDEVMEALTINPDDAPESLNHVPQLKTLQLSGSLDFEPEIFTQMVKSRWRSTPLKTLDLGWFGEGEEVMHAADQSQSEQVLRELAPYCIEGLILFTSSVA